MLIEKIIFNILAFSLFSAIFFKMIKRNDSNYVVILCLQAIGIAINFIEIIFKVPINGFIRFIMYLLSVIIPVIILILEYKNINFSELIYIALAKMTLMAEDNKKAKNFLINLVEKYPESYYGHKMLAEIYEKEGGMRKAIDEYVQVIDINKKDYNSYYKISFLLNELGKKRRSCPNVGNIIKKETRNVRSNRIIRRYLL